MQSNMFMSHTHQTFYHFKLPPHHVSFSNFAVYSFLTHKLSGFATKGYTNISQVIFHSVDKVSTLSLAMALEMQLHDIHPLIFKVFSPSRSRPEKKNSYAMHSVLYIQATEFSANTFPYNGYKLLYMIYPSFISCYTLSASAQPY